MPTFLMPANEMTTSPDIMAELEEQFAEAARQAGCELLQSEFKGGILRLVLDREGGVDLSHCETVSKQVSALLDVAEFDPGRYTLEVSSPGLDRQLYRPSDYARFAGERVRVTWREPDMPNRRTVVGRLERYDEGEPAAIELLEEERQERLRVRLEDIQIARLAPDFQNPGT